MEKEDLIRLFKYGIISSLVSSVLATIFTFSDPWGLGFIGAGSGAPILLLSSVLFFSAGPGVLILIAAMWWFLIGIYIGRVTSNRKHAILMWIGCQIIHFLIAIPYIVGMIA